MKDQQELLDLKQDIDNAKIEKAELEGKLSLLKDQLHSQFSCKSVAEAKKKEGEKQEKIKELEEQIEKDTEELEKEL